jgi:hypothetical protein
VNDPTTRRALLRGLTKLPLIGGSVSLIGNPVSAAEPISKDCLHAYLAWLHYERRALHDFLYPAYMSETGYYIPQDNPGAEFHFVGPLTPTSWSHACQEAAGRAPVVLAAVGCEWRGDRS